MVDDRSGYWHPVHDELRELWLLRHGQSIGNLANDAARDNPTDVLDIADRDMDVPLSDLGIEQATAFGTWLSEQDHATWPDVIVSSPYARALGTAHHVVAAAGLDVEIVFDERLRERSSASSTCSPTRGRRQVPERSDPSRPDRQVLLPPSRWGELGRRRAPVALAARLLVREHADRRVLVVTHEVPIIITRYLIERLDEQGALELSRSGRLANCSLTSYVRDAGGELRLDRDAWTVPLEEEDAPVTDEPDAAVAPR